VGLGEENTYSRDGDEIAGLQGLNLNEVLFSLFG